MKLTLKNFQCHRHAELELSPLTFLIGPSNTGKSAYVRAIGFLTGQLSLGANRLVTRGQKTMSVSLQTNSHIYERMLDKDGVHCKLDDTVYPRMGVNVPEEFTKLATIQFQFEPFFLVTDAPSDVFKKISTVLDLEKLDNLTKLITSDVNALRSQLKLDTESHRELTHRLQIVENIHNQYRVLEQIKFATLLSLINDFRKRLIDLYGTKLQLLKQLWKAYVYYIYTKLLFMLKALQQLRYWKTIVLTQKLRLLNQLYAYIKVLRVYKLRIRIYRSCMLIHLFDRVQSLIKAIIHNRVLLNLQKLLLYLVYIKQREKYVGLRLFYGIYGLYLHLLRLTQISQLERLEELIQICEKLATIRSGKCPTCGQQLPEVQI